MSVTMYLFEANSVLEVTFVHHPFMVRIVCSRVQGLLGKYLSRCGNLAKHFYEHKNCFGTPTGVVAGESEAYRPISTAAVQSHDAVSSSSQHATLSS